MKKIIIILGLFLIIIPGCKPKQDNTIQVKKLNLSLIEFKKALSKTTQKEWQQYLNLTVSWQGEIADIFEDKLDHIVSEGESNEVKEQNLVCVDLVADNIAVYLDYKQAVFLNKGDKIHYEAKLKSIEQYQDTSSISMLAITVKKISGTLKLNIADLEKSVVNDSSIFQQFSHLTGLQKNYLIEGLKEKSVSWSSKIDRIARKGTETQLICNINPDLRLIITTKASTTTSIKANSVIRYNAKINNFNGDVIPATLNLDVLKIFD